MTGLKNRVVLSIAAVFLAAVGSGYLFGQAAGTASISGRITDASGAAIPAASVVVKNTGTSASQTTVTDGQGRYTVPDLPIGSYQIEASKTGFQNSIRSGVTLSVGSAPVIDLQLTDRAGHTNGDGIGRGVAGGNHHRGGFFAGEPDPNARAASERPEL